jgi:hypothetical protein
VWVEASPQDRRGPSATSQRPSSDQAGRIEDLRDEVAYLREQLQQANERDRENRRIIAALTSRIPAIEAPPDERESPQTAREEPQRARSRGLTPQALMRAYRGPGGEGYSEEVKHMIERALSTNGQPFVIHRGGDRIGEATGLKRLV